MRVPGPKYRVEVVGTGKRLQTRSAAEATARRGARGWEPMLCVFVEQRGGDGMWRVVDAAQKGHGRTRKRYLPLRYSLLSEVETKGKQE